MVDAVLTVDSLHLQFGGVAALSDVSFDVGEGEILAIIGPNGAGKTSLVNVLTGLYRPTAGTVRLNGRDITGCRPHEVVRLGLVRTFQNLGLFDELTVMENVLIGRHVRMRGGVVSGALRPPSSWRSERDARIFCRELLDLFSLRDLSDVPVGMLAYGTKKRVEMAKALSSEPNLLLLDEPVAGMNTTESAQIAAIIGRARSDFGASVVMIEHDVEMVMAMADRVMVLDFGKRIALGSPDQVRQTPEVIAAYIGDQVERKTSDDPQLTVVEGPRP